MVRHHRLDRIRLTTEEERDSGQLKTAPEVRSERLSQETPFYLRTGLGRIQ